MPFINNCDFINHWLLHIEDDRVHHKQDSFLVNSAVYPMVVKYFTRSGIDDLQHLGSYELTVGANTFDMEMLIWRTQSAPSSVSLFRNMLKISQFTYFWENKINLFREVDKYDELEEFIAINKLKKHVISVEEIFGVNSLGQPIKVVTFHSTSDKIQRDELLVNYEKFLRTKSLNACHYYFTKSFPWHSSKMFRMYSTPFLNQRIFLELQTFLTCMRELTYSRERHLDLISLCSLKLAFCDELNLTEASSDLEFEINALIERFLRRMVQQQTYIQNGEFDLRRYAVDTNSRISTTYPALHNLIYTFQHIFDSFTNQYKKSILGNIIFTDFKQTLMLNDESTDLKILRDSSNIIYTIDGQNYNKINSNLFCELLKCRNVKEIKLDTNYKWTNDPYLTDFENFRHKCITLLGTNEFNFIEDFIQFLKTMPIFLICNMELEIKEVALKRYNIFKNLEIEKLEFHGLKITFIMLTDLLECDLKNLTISFNKCTIEDKTCTWSLLINGFNSENVTVDILESESTWQYLFESIANHLTKFKLNEFNFKCDFLIICNKYIGTRLVTPMKFRFDEFNTRLELQDDRGQAIDLYVWKNTVDESEDDYENFEFYQ